MNEIIDETFLMTSPIPIDVVVAVAADGDALIISINIIQIALIKILVGEEKSTTRKEISSNIERLQLNR